MTDNSAPTPSAHEIEARLLEVARLLRESQTVDPETRAELAALVEELSVALRSGHLPEAEAARLAGTASHLAESLRQHPHQGTLADARDRVQQALLAAEAQAPRISELARRFLDALASIGI